MNQPRRKLTPHVDGGRDALELMAKMLVPTSYRVPVEGTGTRPGLQSHEIAAAVGYMRDRLAARVATAVALRAERAQVAALSCRVYARIARAARTAKVRPLKMSDPADRWRLRLIVFDACMELVWPERRRPWSEGAKATKMRRSHYVYMHKLATSELQSLLNEGRTGFRAALWGSRD